MNKGSFFFSLSLSISHSKMDQIGSKANDKSQRRMREAQEQDFNDCTMHLVTECART